MNSKKQLAFKFKIRKSFGIGDFIISSENYEAIKWLDAWPKWPLGGILLNGPSGSGKSHLANAWSHKSGARILEASEICFNKFKFQKHVAIENLGNEINGEDILHLINIIKENNGTILITSRSSASRLNLKPPDLLSRIKVFPNIKLGFPSDEFLKKLINKLLLDRGIYAENNVLLYILKRMERSQYFAIKLVDVMDNISLESKKPLTIALAKEALDSIKE